MQDHLTPRYDSFLIVGDLNSEESDYDISNCMDIYRLTNLIKCLTCYESVDNPSSIDMLLMIKTSSFQNFDSTKKLFCKEVQGSLCTVTTVNLIL